MIDGNRAVRASGLALWCLALGLAASPRPAGAADRTAATVLGEIRAVEVPGAEAPAAKRREAYTRKAELIGELLKKDPKSEELGQLLPERWRILLASSATASKALAEMDRIAAGKDDRLAKEAAFARSYHAIRVADGDARLDRAMPGVEKYLKRFPDDDRGAILLGAAGNATSDKARRSAVRRRLDKDYPGSVPARAFALDRDPGTAVGKPFPIAFADAVDGDWVDSASLKGKVVVVDFWATWCGPCVAEMPKMKALYAEYKDKGVEFVGVSLDQPREEGGYDALRSFVAKNKIEWPQFYQGNYWDSEFSKSWGIKSIPAVFVLDAEGNLADVKGRGRLETLIPDLLARAAKPAQDQPAKP